MSKQLPTSYIVVTLLGLSVHGEFVPAQTTLEVDRALRNDWIGSKLARDATDEEVAAYRAEQGDDGLDDLAASMRERLARGLPPLIHNLRGCRVGAKKIEIHAGGRRLAALLRLRGEAVIPASFPVPVELDSPEDAAEVSMMENQLRLPPHPYDQFTGFRRLAEQGLDPDRIAQRFGARASWVRQRLALAALHPDLLELLKRDELPVACAQALTLTADRERQLECWTRLPAWQRDARSIRRLLRDAAIPAAAALFPVADYLAAGGVIERDLFDERDQGAIASPALFAAMQRAEVDRRIAALKAEGWAEVIECDPGPGWYHHVREMDLEEMACAGERGLSAEEAAERDRLLARADTLHGLPEAAFAAERDAYEAELDTIERRLEALDALGKTRIYRPDQRAAGVVLVLFSPPGSLVVREGLTRRSGACGEPATSPGPDGANDNAAGPPQTPEPAEDRSAGKPYASAVLRSLAAAKSHALQDLVSGDPEMALRIAVHHLLDGGYRLNSGHDGYDRVGLRLAEHACAEDNRVLNDGLREVLARIGMPDAIVMRHRSPHFAHVFSGDGYASGYYSYMWSEVLDADAFEAFTETGDPFDPAMAQSLLRNIYSAGNSRPADVLYQAFRGRMPDAGALMRKRGLAA